MSPVTKYTNQCVLFTTYTPHIAKYKNTRHCDVVTDMARHISCIGRVKYKKLERSSISGI